MDLVQFFHFNVKGMTVYYNLVWEQLLTDYNEEKQTHLPNINVQKASPQNLLHQICLTVSQLPSKN